MCWQMEKLILNMPFVFIFFWRGIHINIELIEIFQLIEIEREKVLGTRGGLAKW